jgi:hypothetical protein
MGILKRGFKANSCHPSIEEVVFFSKETDILKERINCKFITTDELKNSISNR